MTAGSSTVRFLAINNCLGTALSFSGLGGNTIAGCFIGTSADGTSAKANGLGIDIHGCSNNTIGGNAAFDLNLISGNTTQGISIGGSQASDGNLILRNWMGVALTGPNAIPNGKNGILLDHASNNTISQNLISGNTQDGILIQQVSGSSTNNVIQQNGIGSDASGSNAIPNVQNGIHILGASGTQISGNLISGNSNNGVLLEKDANNTQIAGNGIGVNTFGSAALPNNQNGIELQGASNTIITGIGTPAPSVISGNKQKGVLLTDKNGTRSTGTLITGNIIGLNITGLNLIPNLNDGIWQRGADNTTIGGTVNGARNIISGNTSDGIAMGLGDHALVQGNYIGTDITGTTALGNGTGLLWNDASYATVGGTTPAARNIISGNVNAGINSFVIGSGFEVIQGNYIGVDALGVVPLPNNGVGMRISGPTNNTIGGTAVGAGNVISGNEGNGIEFTVGPANGTVVQGNFIGTDASGTLNLGNSGTGIVLWSDDVTIGGTTSGAGNIIAYNKGNGLDPGDGIRFVFDVHHNAILSNSIHDNHRLGINFANGLTPNHPWPPGTVSGPNDFQNYPVLTSVVSTGGNTTIVGSLNAAPSTQFLIQFFSNPTADPSGFGEGQTYLGSTTVTTGSNSNVNFSVTLTGVTVPGGNYVSATATDPNSNTSEFSQDYRVIVSADVGITGQGSPNPVFVGGLLTYTFTINNAGPDPAHNVQFADTLPSTLSHAGNFISVPPGITPNVSGQSISADLGTMASGSTITLSFQVQVLATAAPSVTNTGSVTTSDFDPTTPDNANVTTTVQPSADLAITQLTTTAAPNYVGANLVYTITTANNGLSDATGVVVTDPLPANVTFISASGGVTPDINGNLVFNVGNLAAGGSTTLTFTVQPTAAAAGPGLTDTASITGAEHDPNPANNSKTTTTSILPSADIYVLISPSPSPVQAGQNVTYTITAGNNGLSDATGVVVIDTIPSDVTFDSATGGATPDATGKITFNVGNLAAGGSTTLQVVVTTTGLTASPTTDTATISGAEHDPVTSNNSASQNVTVIAVSDLQIGMTDAPDPVHVGDALTYTITVSNAGPSIEPSAVVTDTLPATVTIQSASTSIQGVTPIISGNQVIANLGKLNPGATPVTVTITAIPQAAAAGTIIKATIAGLNTDNNANNNTITTSTTVVPSADLAIQLTGPTSGLVGQNLVYTITATNKGLSPATGVIVTDQLPPLPKDVTFISATGGVTPDGTGKLTFNTGNLASGASVSYSITVQPTVAAVADPPLVDTASITGNEFDPNPANNSKSLSITVSPAVDLAITQFTAAPDPVQIGDNLTYTIVVTNNGPSTATGVTVTSPLGGATYLVGSGTVVPSGTVSLQGTNVVASLGTLAQGATATVNFIVNPTVIGQRTGSTSVSANETDINTSNNSATVTTTVLDLVGTIEFSAAGYIVMENAGSATITVNRVNGSRGTVTVDYKTVPQSTIPGIDYTPVSGTLTFAPGVNSQTIVVPVLANPCDSHDKLVSLVLSNVQTILPPLAPGQGILGTPSTATLTIQDIDPNFSPLTVMNVQWTGTIQDIRQILVTFNKPLIASTATNPANYTLIDVGPDGKYNTLDDLGVQLDAPTYDQSIRTVTLTPTQTLPANQFFHLLINGAAPGGVEDAGGNLLTGDGSTAGTNYTAMLARGTRLRYFTPSGDQVKLQIKGGGIIDDLLNGSGQGIKLSVVGEVPHRTVLSGSMRKSSTGTGRAYLGYSVWGLGQFGDVRVRMYSPPFQIDHYPFSPGSSVATPKSAGAVVNLEGGVVKSAGVHAVMSTSPKSTKRALSAAVAGKNAGGLHSAGVAGSMNRPFHAFHR